jgi:hypothetical protein
VEKRLILNAMERLTRRYVKGRSLSDVLNELIDIRADIDGLIRESQSFADACYKTEADCIIEGSGGRDKSLGQYAGKFAIPTRFLKGQDCGLSHDALKDAGTARLIIRDTELIPNRATVYHRTSLFACNRADDVTEVLALMKTAQIAVDTILNNNRRETQRQKQPRLDLWHTCAAFM